jgi:Sec-independent protein translocase protein TatA
MTMVYALIILAVVGLVFFRDRLVFLSRSMGETVGRISVAFQEGLKEGKSADANRRPYSRD